MTPEEEEMLNSDMMEKELEARENGAPAPAAPRSNKRSRQLAAYREREMIGREFAAQTFNFCWRPTQALKLDSGEVVTVHSVELGPGGGKSQLVNHFPSIKCLTTKSGLLRSLRDYYGALGINLLDAHPTTFIVKNLTREVCACE
jgi:hypothetical protein